MKLNIGKYEFESRDQFLKKLEKFYKHDELGEKVPIFKFAFVELGHIILKNAEYDAEGKEIKEAELSEFYSVDAVFWDLEDHPFGWKTYSIDVKDGQGVHSFAGLDYKLYKF